MMKKPKRNKKNKREEKFISIKLKLILICILFAIIPLLIVNVISTTISKNALHTNSQQLTQELVRQTTINVDTFQQSIQNNIAKFTMVDLMKDIVAVQYSLEKPLDKSAAIKTIEEKIGYIKSTDKDINDIILIFKDGTILGNSSNMEEKDLMTYKDLQIGDNILWKKGLGNTKEKIFVFKEIKDLSGQPMCTVIVNVKLDPIIENIKNVNLLNHSSIYITDSDGSMIYNKDESKQRIDNHVWEVVSEGNKTGSTIKYNSLITYTMVSNGWRVIAEIPERSLTAQLEIANVLVWIIILGAGIIAVIVGLAVARNFSNPIIKLMELMSKAEKGDLTVKVKEKGNDEVAKLCGSFNSMMHNIRQLLEQTKEVVGDTLENSKVLRSSTKQSVHTFEQLALSIGEIAQGTVHQAEEAQQGASNMSSLSDSIQQVMVKTKEIFENNQGAKEMIQTATNSMEVLNMTMVSSIQIAGEIKESILQLSTLTKSIEDIMKLVDGISEQTNLLALNASIEAARAGEVGKGFSVVANEVRNLAEQSKKSTINVRKTLDTIESKTKDTVLLVNKSSNIFSNQEEAVNNAYNVFRGIINNLKNMDLQLQDVNTQVTDMRDLKDRTSSKIDNIAMITQESASASEEVSALSEEQKSVVEDLYDLSYRLMSTMEKLSTYIEKFEV
ncbi:MAG: methyl-accepting chemotaxis protein [Clostridia bacterium]|jgi:methyl-accepting chemotaxis protein|nr:methyl-accepting chemotaxis protein [Clostridia bacterium]